MSYYTHQLDPIALQVGDFFLPWYWLVYVLGFFISFVLSSFLLREQKLQIHKNQLIDVYLLGWLGMIFGARFFYVFLYNWQYYSARPEDIFAIWQGGMSFHGGLVGIAMACLWVARRHRQSPFLYSDLFCTTVPLLLAFGRVANFINGELAGRPTDVPWAVIFPKFYDQLPRHPSQLYEAAGEGLVLLLIMVLGRKKLAIRGWQTGIFLSGYGLIRFGVEFFRNPDPQIGYLFVYFTMGQLLCSVMVLLGVFLLYRSGKLRS